MRKEIDPEKLRTMVRSILPSKARRGPRAAKASENRRVRRSVRERLRARDFETDLRLDSFHAPTVQWRRGADKLNHFLRWCAVLTSGMTRQEKLDYVRRILPRNLIGDHAYGHWEGYCRYPRYRTLPYREIRRRELQSAYDTLRHALLRALADEPDLLGRLNVEIKRRKEPDEPHRLLFGAHDVDAFARDLTMPGKWWQHPPCRYAAERGGVEKLITSGGPPGRPRHLERFQSAKRKRKYPA
jgi:hypothetical protein